MREYIHNLDFFTEQKQIVSINAEIYTTVDKIQKSTLPQITPMKRLNRSEADPFSLDLRRRRKNFSLSKVKKKLQMPSHASNLSVMDPISFRNLSSINAIRENVNKSVNHHMSHPAPHGVSKLEAQAVLPPHLHKSPAKPRNSKITLPPTTRLNLINHSDSSVILPATIAPSEPHEKYIVFSDINIYLQKLLKKRLPDEDKPQSIFKLCVGKYTGHEHKLKPVPVSYILNECNERVLTRIDKAEKSRNFVIQHQAYLDSSLEKAEDEEPETPFHFVYTTDGKQVTDFGHLPDDIQLLLLVNQSQVYLIHKIIQVREKEQRKSKAASKQSKNYKGVMKDVIDDWYKHNLMDWQTSTRRVISKDNLSYNMKMYLKNQFPNMNDEYNKKALEKYAKAAPISVSPRYTNLESEVDTESQLSHK